MPSSAQHKICVAEISLHSPGPCLLHDNKRGRLPSGCNKGHCPLTHGNRGWLEDTSRELGGLIRNALSSSLPAFCYGNIFSSAGFVLHTYTSPPLLSMFLTSWSVWLAGWLSGRTHKHAHVLHIHRHTDTQICTHAHTLTYEHMLALVDTPSRSQTYTHTHTVTHKRTHQRTHKCAHMHAHMYTHAHTQNTMNILYCRLMCTDRDIAHVHIQC